MCVVGVKHPLTPKLMAMSGEGWGEAKHLLTLLMLMAMYERVCLWGGVITLTHKAYGHVCAMDGGGGQSSPYTPMPRVMCVWGV